MVHTFEWWSEGRLAWPADPVAGRSGGLANAMPSGRIYPDHGPFRGNLGKELRGCHEFHVPTAGFPRLKRFLDNTDPEEAPPRTVGKANLNIADFTAKRGPRAIAFTVRDNNAFPDELRSRESDVR